MAAVKHLIEEAGECPWYSPGEKISDYYLDFKSTESSRFNKIVDNLSKLKHVSEVAYQTIVCNTHGQVKNLTTNVQIGRAGTFICENPFPHVINILRKVYYIKSAARYISIICMQVGEETRNIILVSTHEPPC